MATVASGPLVMATNGTLSVVFSVGYLFCLLAYRRHTHTRSVNNEERNSNLEEQ